MDLLNGHSAKEDNFIAVPKTSVDSTIVDPTIVDKDTTVEANINETIKPSGEVFSYSIYEDLPPFFAPLMDLYDLNDPKRDVALISLITHLSAACHFISGNYNERDYYPNLFSFQIGAPASGKSEAIWGKEIIESIDEVVSDPKNPLKGFIIAGDTSRAMLLAKLSANNGTGIISETEGDSITQNYKSDWGNFSAQLRAAYQNETIRADRKGSMDPIRIKKPRFGMNVTMTPGQLSALVKERENGLFSRILFYFLSEEGKFTNPKPKPGGNSKKAACAKMAKDVKQWYTLLQTQELKFEMSEEQWDRFTKFWEDKDLIFKAKYGDNNSDIHRRIALSSFKILMVLSSIRLVEIPTSGVVTCLDKDLETALSIAETLFHHSMEVADILATGSKKANPKLRFIDDLSDDFAYKDFMDLAAAHGVSERTASRDLKKLVENNFIIKTSHGRYLKKDHGK